jgi:hypothetical protein
MKTSNFRGRLVVSNMGGGGGESDDMLAFLISFVYLYMC